MALLFIEMLIFVILVALNYYKIAHPISLITTIVFSSSIFLMNIFVISGSPSILVDILGSPRAQIWFLVFLRIAIASVASYAYFRDEPKLFLLTVFLTALVSIYNREYGWVK